MLRRSRRYAIAAPAAAVAVAIATASCGAAATTKPAATVPQGQARPVVLAALPSGWRGLALASGAVLPFPPGWHELHGDAGTASAAITEADGTIGGYLNATPADRQETFAGWTHFRLSHNASDGDHNVRLISAQSNTMLGANRAACVD